MTMRITTEGHGKFAPDINHENYCLSEIIQLKVTTNDTTPLHMYDSPSAGLRDVTGQRSSEGCKSVKRVGKPSRPHPPSLGILLSTSRPLARDQTHRTWRVDNMLSSDNSNFILTINCSYNFQSPF